MEQLHDEDLPAELRPTARMLREQRHEASAFELDDIKRRISKQDRARQSLKGRYMHRPTTLTAGLVVGALASGSAGALAMTGNLPATRSSNTNAGRAHSSSSSVRDASQGQYQRQCDEFQAANNRNERRNADADRRSENEQFLADRASEAAQRNADGRAVDKIKNPAARRREARRLRRNRIRVAKTNRARRVANINRDRADEAAQRQQDNQDVARCRAGQ